VCVLVVLRQAAAKGAAAHKATLQPPRKLDWYPGGSAWQLNTTRAELRSTPQLARVFDFVKTEDAAGSITRQEAVSMVPPLFLDVKPGHAVLDMCAAPGSKTFQLLEALHAGDGEPQVCICDDCTRRCSVL
jgi:16S rRNA C967 or C1407 C5-methylase (RsmB/RsmF family)